MLKLQISGRIGVNKVTEWQILLLNLQEFI